MLTSPPVPSVLPTPQIPTLQSAPLVYQGAPQLTQKSKEDLSSLINRPSQATNLNNLMMQGGSNSTDLKKAIKIQDLVKRANACGAGIKINY